MNKLKNNYFSQLNIKFKDIINKLISELDININIIDCDDKLVMLSTNFCKNWIIYIEEYKDILSNEYIRYFIKHKNHITNNLKISDYSFYSTIMYDNIDNLIDDLTFIHNNKIVAYNRDYCKSITCLSEDYNTSHLAEYLSIKLEESYRKSIVRKYTKQVKKYLKKFVLNKYKGSYIKLTELGFKVYIPRDKNENIDNLTIFIEMTHDDVENLSFIKHMFDKTLYESCLPKVDNFMTVIGK